MAVLGLRDELTGHARGIRERAGGLGREVPEVPFDSYGLRGLIRELDEQRQAFDERLAAVVDRAAERAYRQVFVTGESDR